MAIFEKFENMDTTRHKMAQAFGFTEKTGIDVLRREDYVTDDDYIEAVAKYDLERMSPEFREARKRAQAQYKAKQEAEAREHEKKILEDSYASVSLSDYDNRQADQIARQRARADLAANKIAGADLGNTISKYYDEERKRIKQEKAGNAAMNAMLREQLRHG